MSQLLLHQGGITRDSQSEQAPSRAAVLVRAAVLCVAYFAGSMLGYLFTFPSSYISVMWPPNTVLLVALLLSPTRHWPWLLLIVYPVHLLAEAQQGVTPFIASLYYAFDCVLVPFTAGTLRHFGLSRLELADFRQALLFIAVVTGAAALASLTWSPLTVMLWIGGDIWSQWGLVCLSNVLPFLIATPFLVIGLTRGLQIIRSTSQAQFVEFGLLIVGLVVCGMGVFGLQARLVGHPAALAYAPLPFLLWAAVRFGPGGLSFSFLVFALIAIIYTLAGKDR